MHTKTTSISSISLHIISFVAVICVMFVGLTKTADAKRLKSSEYRDEIFRATNDVRIDNDRVQLVQDAVLTKLATDKAREMATSGQFAHVLRDGRTFENRLHEYRYTYTLAGENLAVHFTNADAVVAAWMASPSHRFNLMHPGYGRMGIGVAYGMYDGHKGWFIVQVFSN